MKRILFTLSLLLQALAVSADRAQRVEQPSRQPDGSVVTTVLAGDEHLHYHATTDGHPLLRQPDGSWVYAYVSGGELSPSSTLAHDVSQRSAREQLFLQLTDSRAEVSAEWSRRLSAANAHRAVRAAANVRRMQQQPTRAGMLATSVKKKGLIILVQYPDLSMQPTSTLEVFQQMANGLGAPVGNNVGSIREYFLAQSYGQLDLEFDVVGPYTLPQPMAYYGSNAGGRDSNVRQQALDAIQIASNDVNFADYDWDGNGEVEQVYIIYAGFAESNGGPEDSVWPHEWKLASPVVYNGVTLSTYACSSELTGRMGSAIGGIGTACHEFSHCLGLPDFYDTADSNSFAMGSWDLMSSGNHNGNGYHPVGYTAYERWFAGWLTPTELSTAAKVQDMPAIEDEPVAYVVYNDGNRNEYYLLANHQQRGFDAYNPAHGMMVLHVTYDRAAWSRNTVNTDPALQRMTMVACDASFNSGTEAGDLWPGPGRRTALTDTSIPAAVLYMPNTDGARLMHKPIEEISEDEGCITFQFMGGIHLPVPAPTATATSNSITVTWEPVADAVSYDLECVPQVLGPQTPAEALLLSEDFALFTTGTGSDGSSNIDATIDSYTSVPGWLPEYVYPGASGAKVGRSTGGSLATPLLSAPLNGAVTLRFMASRYASDSNLMDVFVLSAEGQTLASTTQSVAGRALVVQFEGIKQAFRIKFQPKKRVYLNAVAVYDGLFSREEIEQSAAECKAYGMAGGMARARFNAILSTSACSYDVKGLTYGDTYIYRLRAVDSNGIRSDWSDWQAVTVNGEGNGVAVPQAEAGMHSEAYDLSGRAVVTRPARGGSMPRGIYIVGGRKVVVR